MLDEDGVEDYERWLEETAVLPFFVVYCEAPTDGSVRDAYEIEIRAIVERKNITSEHAFVLLFSNLSNHYEWGGDAFLSVFLKGDVWCTEELAEDDDLSATEIAPTRDITVTTALALPEVITDYTLEVTDLTAECDDFQISSGGGRAVIGSIDGVVAMSLDTPFGLALIGDGTGGFEWIYKPPPVSSGETEPRELTVESIGRVDDVLTLGISGRLFTEAYPSPAGCSFAFTGIYSLDGVAIDWLASLPVGGADEVSVENPNLEFGAEAIMVEGQLVNITEEMAFHVWMEFSDDLSYYLGGFLPDASGYFTVTVPLVPTEGSFMRVAIFGNNKLVTSTQGNTPARPTATPGS